MINGVINARHWRQMLAVAIAMITLAFNWAIPSYSVPQPTDPQANQLRIDGNVALASLISLSDGHLQKVADSIKLLAGTGEAQTADWEKINGPLGKVAQLNIPAAMWFVLPDGTYWTVDSGRERQKLSDRTYFPRLMAGKTVMGDLVVSKSTGKAVAIVAVPIVRNGSVVGALGSSVYLDRLSNLINKEMALDKTMIFYSFDSQPLVGLDWDPELIFLEPLKQENQSLKRAFQEMLTKDQGTVSYEYRGRNRQVIYRKSPVTNWWYAFGVIPEGREK